MKTRFSSIAGSRVSVYSKPIVTSTAVSWLIFRFISDDDSEPVSMYASSSCRLRCVHGLLGASSVGAAVLVVSAASAAAGTAAGVSDHGALVASAAGFSLLAVRAGAAAAKVMVAAVVVARRSKPSTSVSRKVSCLAPARFTNSFVGVCRSRGSTSCSLTKGGECEGASPPSSVVPSSSSRRPCMNMP